jgi:hypothetical protein
MKLAHLVPTACLGLLPAEQQAHLALANLVIRNGEYRDYYAGQATQGKLVILDNPVHENVRPQIDEWRLACQIIKPQVAVLPDVIDSAYSTLKMAKWSLDAAPDVACEFMGVPHADDDDDYIACAEELVYLGCTWIGISLDRKLNDDELAYLRRCRRITLLRDAFGETVKLHLLGISERGFEFTNKYLQAVCASADTSKYAVWFLKGHPVIPPVPIMHRYPGRNALSSSMQYFDYRPVMSPETAELFKRNLTRWLKYAEEGEL